MAPRSTHKPTESPNNSSSSTQRHPPPILHNTTWPTIGLERPWGLAHLARCAGGCPEADHTVTSLCRSKLQSTC